MGDRIRDKYELKGGLTVLKQLCVYGKCISEIQKGNYEMQNRQIDIEFAQALREGKKAVIFQFASFYSLTESVR